jgi:hypothetical protein
LPPPIPVSPEPSPVKPLFVIDILSTPPVENLIVSAAGKLIPVFVSSPTILGAETDPATPLTPVVPESSKLIIK